MKQRKDFSVNEWVRFGRRAAIWSVLGMSMVMPLGCGGSGTTAPAPGASGRAVAIAVVRNARRAAHLFPVTESAAGVFKPRQSRAASYAFDTRAGLYEGVYRTDDGFHVTYYADSTGTTVAGSIRFANTGDGRVQVAFDMPTGYEPTKGVLTLVASNADGSAGSMQGKLTNPVTREQAVFALSYAPESDESFTAITGSLWVSGTAGTIAFRNISGKANGTLVAGIDANGIAGKIVGARDESGTLTLETADGSFRAEWDAQGAGRLILEDGTAISVADFDAVPPDA